MKQTLTFIILLLLVQTSFAQKIRFANTGNSWLVAHCSSDGCYYYTTYCQGSVIIDSVQYYQMGQYLNVREDTTNKKVYFYIDSIETLTYDYSLQLGDTFRLINGKDSFEHFVSVVDSVVIQNTQHKVWELSPTSNTSISTAAYTVIEGIGSTKGFMFPLSPEFGLASTSLHCFEINGFSPPLSDTIDNYFDNVRSCRVSASNLRTDNQILTISPHPADITSTVTLPYTIKDGSIIIFNTVGRLVAEQAIHNQTSVSLRQLKLSTGMYYYRIADKQNGKTWQGKLVYQ